MVRYTSTDGTRSKVGLGRYPAIGLADARAKALGIFARVYEGADPAREKRARKREARKPRLEKP